MRPYLQSRGSGNQPEEMSNRGQLPRQSIFGRDAQFLGAVPQGSPQGFGQQLYQGVSGCCPSCCATCNGGSQDIGTYDDGYRERHPPEIIERGNQTNWEAVGGRTRPQGRQDSISANYSPYDRNSGFGRRYASSESSDDDYRDRYERDIPRRCGARSNGEITGTRTRTPRGLRPNIDRNRGEPDRGCLSGENPPPYGENPPRNNPPRRDQSRGYYFG